MYYIVIGTYDADVSYGVDSSSYIMGVFSEEKEAVKYRAELYENKSAFENEDGRFLMDDIYGVKPCSKERATERGLELIRYCDFSYDILSFNGKPIFCGGAHYLE